MKITEVRVKLMDDQRYGNQRLLAFCCIIIDNVFVVKDLKIIGGEMNLSVAMPSRKLTARCDYCKKKNPILASYCNWCGKELNIKSALNGLKNNNGKTRLYADVAHPIDRDCRKMIENAVIKEYFAEKKRSKQPGYVSVYDDYDCDD